MAKKTTAKKAAPRVEQMKPKEFKRIIAKLGRSERKSAPMLGISVRQCQRFAWGEMEVSSPVRKLLRIADVSGLTGDQIEKM